MAVEPYDFSRLLEHLKHYGFGEVKRYSYDKFTTDLVLKEMEVVGRSRLLSFAIDDDNRFAYTNIARWLAADPAIKQFNPETGMEEFGDVTKGLYIAGPAGTGKTWAVEILKYLARWHGVKFSTFNSDRLLDITAFRADEIAADYARTGDIEMYVNERVLAINDFGSEPPETLYMGNRVNVLRQLIERRGDDPSKITIITANVPMNSKRLADIYGDRVQSRLRAMCNNIVIKGKDRRK